MRNNNWTDLIFTRDRMKRFRLELSRNYYGINISEIGEMNEKTGEQTLNLSLPLKTTHIFIATHSNNFFNNRRVEESLQIPTHVSLTSSSTGFHTNPRDIRLDLKMKRFRCTLATHVPAILHGIRFAIVSIHMDDEVFPVHCRLSPPLLVEGKPFLDRTRSIFGAITRVGINIISLLLLLLYSRFKKEKERVFN